MAEAVKKEAVKKTAVKAVEKAVVPEKKTDTVKKPAVKKTSLTRAKKAEDKRNSRKVLQGAVISNKMDKTGVIAIARKVPHPLYKKVVTKTTKLKFHDEKNECDIGDTVEIMETRHFSKDKYFRLVRIVEKVK
jgi:small subunit ribosomal protein S17